MAVRRPGGAGRVTPRVVPRVKDGVPTRPRGTSFRIWRPTRTGSTTDEEHAFWNWAMAPPGFADNARDWLPEHEYRVLSKAASGGGFLVPTDVSEPITAAARAASAVAQVALRSSPPGARPSGSRSPTRTGPRRGWPSRGATPRRTRRSLIRTWARSKPARRSLCRKSCVLMRRWSWMRGWRTSSAAGSARCMKRRSPPGTAPGNRWGSCTPRARTRSSTRPPARAPSTSPPTWKPCTRHCPPGIGRTLRGSWQPTISARSPASWTPRAGWCSPACTPRSHLVRPPRLHLRRPAGPGRVRQVTRVR